MIMIKDNRTFKYTVYKRIVSKLMYYLSDETIDPCELVTTNVRMEFSVMQMT